MQRLALHSVVHGMLFCCRDRDIKASVALLWCIVSVKLDYWTNTKTFVRFDFASVSFYGNMHYIGVS